MILITGGNGTLGTYLQNEFGSFGISYDAPSRKDLDLSSEESLKNFFSGNQNYDCVMHLAAETNVDLCEREPQHAYNMNFRATENLARYASKLKAYTIYISTSAVFGGTQKLRYCELDTVQPLNFYGSSKLLGEAAIRRLCPEHLVVRSSWMIGGGPARDKKFISKILPDLLANKDIQAVNDKYGSLTYAKTLASFLVHAYETRSTGTVHFSSSDYCSRYGVAQFIAQRLKSTSKLIPVDSHMFPLPAQRPISEALYTVALQNWKEPTWQEIIIDYLKEWI
jgi:dTDP-4-dehydrorhamnose reductase